VLVITVGRGWARPTLNFNAFTAHHGGPRSYASCSALPPAGPPSGWRNHRTRGQNHPTRLLSDPAAFGFKREAELPLECDLWWWMRPRW